MLSRLALTLTLLLSQASPESAISGGKGPVVQTDATDSSVTVKVGGALGGMQPVTANPLLGCTFHGPVLGSRVRELLSIDGGPVTIGARVAPLDDEQLYGVVKCDRPRFDGKADAVWPIGESPPDFVVEAVVTSAVAQLEIPAPVPQTAPDGDDTPFLVNLPVWLWLDDSAWSTQAATAGLGPLLVSATATATPSHTMWNPGDGTISFSCEDNGQAWRRSLSDDDATCTTTYRVTTGANRSFTLGATAVFDLTISCSPARLCDGVEVPSVLTASASRPVQVTEARSVITG